MILIIGSGDEYHSKHVFDYIRSRGKDVKYLDTRTIPGEYISSFSVGDGEFRGYIYIDGDKIEFDDIQSIYWRWYYDGIPASERETTIGRSFNSLVSSTFRSIDCNWVNSVDGITMHKDKPYQLNIMSKSGIRIPKTLITTDKDEALAFLEDQDYDVIFKHVRGGMHTQPVEKSEMIKDALNVLKFVPLTFQERIYGDDIRIHVVGQDVFAAKIMTDHVDFRSDPDAKIVPFDLPDNIINDCYKIMDILGLKFSGIDARYSEATNEYVFFEANPSPMFLDFEEKARQPITNSLYNLLAS